MSISFMAPKFLPTELFMEAPKARIATKLQELYAEINLKMLKTFPRVSELADIYKAIGYEHYLQNAHS
ncbi:hypothetical protein TNCV_4158241 [Trichonephila clavipes]|nr:hypothetical protein TNCV_4158241 [Trichonephila clavipes]